MTLQQQIIIIAICSLVTFSPLRSEGKEPVRTIRSLDTQVLHKQKKISRLKRGIEKQANRISSSTEKETSLLSELDEIDNTQEQQRRRLSTLQEELKKYEQRHQELQLELDSLIARKKVLQSFIKKRLAAYYRMGPVGIMNVAFSATSLPELLLFSDYFETLVHHDQQAINSYRRKIQELTEIKTALEQAQKLAAEAVNEVEKQEKRLADTRFERMTLLERVNTEKKLYQRALAEIKTASNQVTTTLEKLKLQNLREKKKRLKKKTASLSLKKKKPSSTPFASRKGLLDPPVPGTVVTGFGKNTKGKFGITTYANGINIKAPAGTLIKAIHGGKIVYSGTLRGYGKLLIIDHGEQYYSLISRAETFFKREGEYIAEGEPIGLMGDKSGLLSEGLHLEIRHGTKPVNPLQWINNATLTIKATSKTEKK